jgi:hypothetical protein
MSKTTIIATVVVLALQGAHTPLAANETETLKHDPRLQVKLKVQLQQPKVKELVDEIAKATGLTLSLADNVPTSQPAYEKMTWQNLPAWAAMKQVAQATIVAGKWEKTDSGYRLVSSLDPGVAMPNNPEKKRDSSNLIWILLMVLSFPLLAVAAIVLVRRVAKQG